jgi:hypothetical protein
MIAALMVDTMVATVEAVLDAPLDDPLAEMDISTTAERQLRLIVLAIPRWRSDPSAAPGVPDAEDPDPDAKRPATTARRRRATR